MRNEECLIAKCKPGVLLCTDQHQYFPILFLILKYCCQTKTILIIIKASCGAGSGPSP